MAEAAAAQDATTTVAAAGGSTTVQPDLSSAGVQNTSNGSANVAPHDWIAALPETSKLYVQNKGFKDTAQVIESYQNLEKLMGAPKERLLKLPEKFDSPEMAEVYDRLGRPKAHTEYNLVPPGAGEVNKEFTEFAQKLFHDAGLSKTQGEKIASKWNEYALGDIQKQNDSAQQTLDVDKKALQREWGAAHDQNINVAARAAKTFGLGEADVTKLEKALGYSATLKFLANVGEKLSEDTFVDGSNGSGFTGAMTPARAQAEIDALKNDQEFIRKYANGDRTAFEKMTRLHQLANPDLPQD